MARPKTPLLSPVLIADAAMALVEQGKPFGVNAIARALGVTPSSLYNHVAGRDEIVELMRGRLVEQYTVEPSEDWETFLASAVRMQRRMYGEHPFLVPLIVEKVITDRATLLWYDQLAAELAKAGFPDDQIVVAITVVDAFAIGFGLDLAGPADAWGEPEGTAVLGRAITAGPAGRVRGDEAFEWGLSMLIDGLRRRLGPPPL